MSTSKILKDFRGYFHWKVIRKMRLRIGRAISTLLMRISLFSKGVNCLGKVHFFGRAVFVRYPESTIQLGKNCVFASDSHMNLAGINRKCSVSTLRAGAKIIIGDNSKFSGAVIGAAEQVTIGEDVLVGANAFITDFDWHNIDPGRRMENCDSYSPVTIKNNVWIGMNALILKGVTIGENSVIGANSVVVRDIPANVIAAGNPCKVVKELNQISK